MIVVDASAVADVLLERQRGDWVAEQLASADGLHAPHLLDYEVASVIRGHVRGRLISLSRGRRALQDLSDLPVTRYPAVHLLPRILDLRDRLSAYDAAYVALAETLGVPLVTSDRALAEARGHKAEILTPAR